MLYLGISSFDKCSRCGFGDAKCNQFRVCRKIASYVRNNVIGIISRQYGLFGFLPAEISPYHTRDDLAFCIICAHWGRLIIISFNKNYLHSKNNSLKLFEKMFYLIRIVRCVQLMIWFFSPNVNIYKKFMNKEKAIVSRDHLCRWCRYSVLRVE